MGAFIVKSGNCKNIILYNWSFYSKISKYDTDRISWLKKVGPIIMGKYSFVKTHVIFENLKGMSKICSVFI